MAEKKSTQAECITCWTLRRSGYSSQRPCSVPFTSERNRKMRWQFAEDHRRWKIGKMLSDLMRFDFCCNIPMGGPEFGIKKHENMDLSCVISAVQLEAWIIFSWNTYVGSLSIKDHWNSTAYYGITTDHVFQFTTTVYSSLADPLGQHILPQIKNSGMQQWDICVKVAATLAGTQSRLAPLGRGGKEDLDPGRAANLSRTITGCPHNSMGCNFE